jgi:hypothetical protein
MITKEPVIELAFSPDRAQLTIYDWTRDDGRMHILYQGRTSDYAFQHADKHYDKHHVIETQEQETKWAVVEVIPTIHGTDETQGVTLARGLTYEAAMAWKNGYFHAMQDIGRTTEDGFLIYNHPHRPDTGLLVTTEDRAP